MIDRQDPVMERVRRADPAPGPAPAPPIDAVWRRIEADDGPPRRRLAVRLPSIGGLLAVATSAVAVAVVVLAIVLLGHAGTSAAPKPAPAATMTFAALPVGAGRVSSSEVRRAAAILGERLHAALPHVHVQITSGHSKLTLSVRGTRLTAALRGQLIALTSRGELGFYDWEASVLTPRGPTALLAFASPAERAAARLLSQGRSAGPGTAAGGSLDATRALRLAARQAPGRGPNGYVAVSPGCRGGAGGATCALLGPAPTRAGLRRLVPARSRSLVDPVRVPAGTTIVSSSDVPTRYFVLRGAPALTGAQISGSTAGTGAGGEPDVTLRFTPVGASRFHALTRRIARTALDYGSTPDFFHFAIVLDGHLLTVPYIDATSDPNGISTRSGEITGGFTRTTARELAAALRFGVLPVALTPS